MMKKAFKFEVRDEKKIRVIVDTDAACEADDPFAIFIGHLSASGFRRNGIYIYFSEMAKRCCGFQRWRIL